MSGFVAQSLPLLRTLPVPLAALLMQQVQRYDYLFPREQHELERTLASLRPPRSPGMQRAVDRFAALRLPPELNTSGWETAPALWTERITAAMWSSGEIAAFRDAAKSVLPAETAADGTVQPRAVVIVYDDQLRTASVPELFQRLRPFGTHFLAVDGAGNHSPAGATALQSWLVGRAIGAPQPYAHWLISGASSPAMFATPSALPSTNIAAPTVTAATAASPQAAPSGSTAVTPSVAALSYAELRPARQHLLRMMNDARLAEGTGGPEGMRDAMRALTPRQMGLPANADPVLSEFVTDVLVGGSGTQLYATTFVQWTAREVLRRAQPNTLVAHFTPRNESASMDLRLSQPDAEPPLDPAGSLVDAEMAAHLTFVNLQRLPGANRSHFLAWHPGYGQAMLLGPGVPAATQRQTRIQLGELLARMT